MGYGGGYGGYGRKFGGGCCGNKLSSSVGCARRWHKNGGTKVAVACKRVAVHKDKFGHKYSVSGSCSSSSGGYGKFGGYGGRWGGGSVSF